MLVQAHDDNVIIISAIGILIIAMIFHELGHWITLKALKKNSFIKFGFKDNRLFCGVGEEKDYKDLTDNQKIIIYLFGIILGIAIISIFSILYYSNLIMAV